MFIITTTDGTQVDADNPENPQETYNLMMEKRFAAPVIDTVEKANQVSMAWIAENVDLDEARKNYQPQPRNNAQTRHQFTMPPLGTWRVDPWDEMSVLVEIPINQFQPSEGDWDMALRYPETQLYIQWQREGHEPPPLSLIMTNNGNLRTLNRRRWLAARESGVKVLKCWYSPSHPIHFASPKWALKYLDEVIG